MGRGRVAPPIKDGDWVSVRQAINRLSALILGSEAEPTYSGLTLTGLTSDRLIGSSSGVLQSEDLTSWIAGTSNQIAVADDSDGSVTLSTPQDIHTGASPTFGGLTIFDATPILVFKDSNSLGAASVGFIEWRDSGGGRAGFFGNSSSGNDDLLWKNEQGGNIGIQTTGAGEFQIFANTVISNTAKMGSISSPNLITFGVNSLVFSVGDDQLSAFQVVEGERQYLNIKTSNGAEIMEFGASTTNPLYNFFGSGLTTLGGNLLVNGGNIGITADSDLLTLTSGNLEIDADINISSGSILSDSGAISFGNENLSTSGTLLAGVKSGFGATNAGALLNIEGTLSSSDNNFIRALRFLPTLTDSVTSFFGALIQPTISGSFTQAGYVGLRIPEVTLTGGASITRNTIINLGRAIGGTNNASLIITGNAGVAFTGNWGIYDNMPEHWTLHRDSKRIYWGAAEDSYIEFDGDSMNIVANAVTAADDLNLIAQTINITGITTLGDGGATDYTQYAADGYMTMAGTARVLRNVDFEPKAVKQGGVGPADGGGTGFPTHDYDQTNDESVLIHWEIPHEYASAGEIHLHVEFFVDTAPASAESVTWGVEYKKLSIGDNFDFSSGTTTVIVNTNLTTGTPANDGKTHSSAEINLTTTGFEPMDVVLIRIFRDADASEAGATDDFGGDARVFNYHLMYLSDKMGQAS